MEPLVTDEMNEGLCKDFTNDEIADALFQIDTLKAPGPDASLPAFFQRNWDVVKQDITKAVKNFFEMGNMPEGVNEIAIILIPKKDAAELLKDFRPISLCNVIYKVISKCLVNRLRPLLQDMIAPTQSAFIPGRLITDNALLAFECLHAIRNGNNSCKKVGAFKLDLTKAYDRVDWDYLKGALGRLGFHRKWLRWVMECVTKVNYTVRLNNESLRPFKPSRSLQQGDPLSPYLFLFVADGLSRILQHQVRNQTLKEIKVCRRAPSISHLLVADDTLLFLEANAQQALVI
jgi:hypothetical protein